MSEVSRTEAHLGPSGTARVGVLGPRVLARIPRGPPDPGVADKDRDAPLSPGWGLEHGPCIPGRQEHTPRAEGVMHFLTRRCLIPSLPELASPLLPLRAHGEPQGRDAPRTPHRAPEEGLAGSHRASLGTESRGGQ